MKPISSSRQWPVVLAGMALVGGGMFLAGRAMAPASSVAVQSTSEEEHEEEGHDEHGHEEGTVSFTPEALQSAGIEVARASLSPQFGTVPFNGQIEASPDNVARVASVVPGRITKLHVSIGQRVRKGEILATVESRAVGEAQSAYAQAASRLKNARAAYELTLRQARAGVFSQSPLETAQRTHAEALAEVRAQETALRQARITLENTTRLAQAGSFARPSLEAARSQFAAAQESLKAAQAAAGNAGAAVPAAQAELERRRETAAGGGYSSRPVDEARRSLVASQSARATAQSEVAATRANLNRAKSLSAEGLISRRDLETAQTAFDTATARLDATQADENTAVQELERQQKLAASNVNGTAEVRDAEAKLAAAQADSRTRAAEVQRATEGLRLAEAALKREQTLFRENIANRREVSEERARMETAHNALAKARETLTVAEAALRRETRIHSQNLNNLAQVQAARAQVVSAQSDLAAANTALSLLKSAPGGSALVPLRSPLTGAVQSRDVTQGEVIEADRPLMTIVNLSTVHVDMFLPERDISRIHIGSPVHIAVDAVPGQSFAGRIELIHSELDPKMRTVEAHAEIANPGSLRPGMFARGSIRAGGGDPVILIPSEAVQDLEGKNVVFVAGEEAGEFEAREVQAGAKLDGRTHILRGLKPGEKFVARGAFMVKAQSMKAELGHEH